jgi:glycerophosphoryl diester phosphodiesterase
MEKAVQAGVHGLEIDVHRTRDGTLVLIHDDTLDRTTNGSGRVADHTLEQLRRLDAAYWWVPGKTDDHDPGTPTDRYVLRGQAPENRDLGIPTMEELLVRFPSMPLTIEIKAASVVEPLVRLLREHDRQEDLVVSSFKDSIVRELERHAPDLPLAPGAQKSFEIVFRARLGLPLGASEYVALQLPPRNKKIIDFEVVTGPFVAKAHRAKVAVHVWTINEEAEMRRLIAMGVDGIMTDRPTGLAEILAES